MQTTSFDIHHDLVIEACAQSVFDAVSLPEKLINWWPKRCSGKPELGSEYNFYFTDEYDWYGEVITCSPGAAFHIKMTRSDDDWNPTSFGFDLEEKGGQTQLRFWHKGWPECNEHYRRSSFCWALLLKGLKDYVGKGVVVPFEERS